MARTLSEIYSAAKLCRDNYLELTSYAGESNSSKMSVMDAFTWVTSACIWTFENLFDVFKVDLAKDLQNRVNGTAGYFSNALLKYQSGDDLVVDEDGGTFSYASVNTSKRIITKVSYHEEEEAGFNDKTMCFKIATGEAGAYQKISDSELTAIRAYLNKILFAGQHARVISRNGDILVPRVKVYYDGSIKQDELYQNIEKALTEYIAGIDFDGYVYTQKVIDCIQGVDHVTDVSINEPDDDTLGIFFVSYTDGDELLRDDHGAVIYQSGRYFIPSSGYLRQSSGSGEEASIDPWNVTIQFALEDGR